ncbi:hypothetical protein BDQ17DRAFT_1364120 [Cyathus striatus]|nr:hypothetical protein BDQ17DRAFT_1364120 [Cyathus striatus]
MMLGGDLQEEGLREGEGGEGGRGRARGGGGRGSGHENGGEGGRGGGNRGISRGSGRDRGGGSRIVKDDSTPGHVSKNQDRAVARNAGTRASKPKPKINPNDKKYALVLEAAQATVSVLDKIGLKCAVIGSLASKLYGASRIPNDVDILTLFRKPMRALTTAQINDMIIASDRRFFRKMPKDSTNGHLWFCSSGPAGGGESADGSAKRVGVSNVDGGYREENERRKGIEKTECKVDILIPGMMSLPDLGVEADGVRWLFARSPVPFLSHPSMSSNGKAKAGVEVGTSDPIMFPVLPFAILLLQKLQDWSNHRISSDSFDKKMQPQDEGDMRNLLRLREMKILALTSSSYYFSNVWTTSKYFPAEFLEVSKKRVRLYCHYFTEKRDEWMRLGFEVMPRAGEVEEEMELIIRRAVGGLGLAADGDGEEDDDNGERD